MADEAITITIRGGIDGKIATSLREIATQALSADNALDLLRTTLSGFSAANAFKSARSDVREFRNEVNRASQTQKTFATSTDQVRTSLQSATGAASKYGSELRKIDGASVTVGRGLTSLKSTVLGFAGAFGGIFAIQGYARAQDALTGMQNKIRSLTSDVERQAGIQQELVRVSDSTRTSIAATTDGFVRFSKAMQGASDAEVLRFTETLNKSLIAAGRSTSEVNSVVIQLGQALTSGRLQGDEFRALSENLPREALQAFANQLGVGVDQLKALSTQGLITTDVIRAAFADLATSMDEQFARSIPTISQALEMLNNRFILFTAQSSAGANMLAQAIIFVGNNLNIIIPIVAAFAAAWALVGLVKIAAEIAILVGGIIQFTVAMVAANATMILWVAAGAALLAVVLAIGFAYMKLTGQVETFDEYMGGMIDGIKSVTAGIVDWAKETLGLTGETEDLTTMQGKLMEATGLGTTSFEELTEATNASKVANDNWAKATNDNIRSVISSYNRLTAAAREAAAAAGAAQFAKNDPGPGNTSTIGSFTTLGKGAGMGGNSISTLPAFATGGSFMVGGRGGVDKNIVSFRATKGERVDVSTPAQQRSKQRDAYSEQGGGVRGAPQVYITVNTPDADSFRLSRGQIAANIAAALSGV